jgi:phage tail sheath gpL-like
MLTGEIAAKTSAWRAKYRQNDPTANLIRNGGGNRFFSVWRPPFLDKDRISKTETNAGLNAGISTIRYTRQGKAFMVRGITTRFQDINGAPDYRTLDDIKVDMLDWFADDVSTNFTIRFPNYKLREDSGLPPADEVADPRLIRSWIFDMLKGYELKGWVKNVDKWGPLLKVSIPGTPSGRAVASVPVDVIDLFAQLVVDAYQIG